MALIEMLPDSLRQEILLIPEPEKFVVQTLKEAVKNYQRKKQIKNIRGKYKHVPFSSDDLALKKKQEIELEEVK